MLATTAPHIEWQSTERWLGHVHVDSTFARSKSQSVLLRPSSINASQYMLVIIVFVALLY